MLNTKWKLTCAVAAVFASFVWVTPQAKSAVILGPELIQNWNMESGDPTLDWAIFGNPASITISTFSDTDNYYSSFHSLRVEAEGPSVTGGVSQLLQLQPGSQYVLDLWYVSTEGIYLALGAYRDVLSASESPTTWKNYTGIIDVGPGGAPIDTSILFYTFGTNGSFNIDNVSFKQVIPVPEPGSFVLAGFGGALVLFLRRRSQKTA